LSGRDSARRRSHRPLPRGGKGGAEGANCGDWLPTDLAAKIRAINAATAKLNCVIERSVATAHDADVNIYYVDVTEEFAGHRIGCQCTDPFIDAPPSGEAFHPTAEGYAAYAEAIKIKLPNGWLDKQDRSV
jgi:hypothetical protein